MQWGKMSQWKTQYGRIPINGRTQLQDRPCRSCREWKPVSEAIGRCQPVLVEFKSMKRQFLVISVDETASPKCTHKRTPCSLSNLDNIRNIANLSMLQVQPHKHSSSSTYILLSILFS